MKNPLVVGYKGEIGSFILQGLLKFMPKANNIWCFDVNETEREKKDRIKKSDVIFLCVPLHLTGRYFIKYEKHLKGKIIVEQTSLKCSLFDHKFSSYLVKNFKIFSMHILFRPSATNPEDRKIAVIDNKWPDDILKFINSLCDNKVRNFQDNEHHDWEMALQQALIHRAIIALDNCILYGDTFMAKKVKELAKRIRSGDHELYQTIQSNPHAEAVFKSFNEEMKSFKIDY